MCWVAQQPFLPAPVAAHAKNMERQTIYSANTCCRQVVRQVYLAKQRRYHVALHQDDSSFPFIHQRTSDDSVRFLSAFFALSKALDKAVVVARTACNDLWIQQQAGQRSWNQFRLWFGR